ncbi:unnamed protein product (macronuclear) [Paramecium tetraurelia]|uniref:Arrestin-like N-terminal domain-containing protein n=1 Tax=Paramecium tetraurelia TaxID=5888 RepID=A0CL31_PARTE|nr:uncharacterized protein GSPATT00008045001 [Paramecium tetraurelia]CAK71498.1 unnamed protein product [Paramecium tetraurelia]|eukprot:XP_001438895.1 hypothetical protein (macronuclear) [Paramecium tetraurelia strain d4-2]
MGNKSGSEFGGIMIRTEKQLYFAGDIVQGNIYLHIIKQGFCGKEVKLTILGKEKTNWETGSGTRRRTHEGKNIFHQITVVAHTFEDDNLMVGSFIFPFKVHLSANLPGTFYYKDDVLASLTYKVIARVVSTSKSINDIKNKQVLILREPIKEIISSKQKRESSQIVSGCCIKRGTSSIEVKVEKNIYFPTEFLNFSYDIDNSNCKLDVDKVDSVLVNRLRLRSNSDSEHILEFQLNYQHHKGPQKGNKIQPIQKQDYQLQLINLKNPPQHLTPSIIGNCVNSIYYLKVQPHYEGCSCCSPRPTVKIPITVLAIPPKEYIQPLIQPENWNPQVFQPIIIQSNTQGQANALNKDLQQMSNPMKN